VRTITGVTAIKGKNFSGLTRTFADADDLWTEEIDDVDADSGCASRTTLSELTGAHMREPTSSQLEQFFEQAITAAAQLQCVYQPQVEYEKSENLNSIDDEDISESVSCNVKCNGNSRTSMIIVLDNYIILT